MSVDGGTNWTTILAGYSVVQAGLTGSGTTTWNSVTTQPGFFTLTAAAGAAADEQANVLFRLRSTVTTAAAGTNRIDNFIVSTVPAPGAIALLGLAGLIGRRRR
jgi:MYXO-CTERM domain-containing protein